MDKLLLWFSEGKPNPFPFFVLKSIPQNPMWHPEIWVWDHTNYVLEQSMELSKDMSDRDSMILKTCSIIHDVGKCWKTQWNYEKQKWTSNGHENASAVWWDNNWRELGYEEEDANLIRLIVDNHMVPNNIGEKGLSRLRNKFKTEHDLYLFKTFVKADHSGRPPLPWVEPPWYHSL